MGASSTESGRIRPHALQRMLGRDPREHRTTTPLELLFDLTFVIAFAQASDQLAHYLSEGHVATAVWGFVFVVISVAWAWINFTWFASAFGLDDWLQRGLTFVRMIGVIILALGIPAVFASIDAGRPFDFRVVAAGYVVMRAALVVMWIRVAVQDPHYRRVAVRYAVYNSVIQVAWVTVAFLRPADGATTFVLVAILWALEFALHPFATAGAKAADGSWQGTPWNAGHIVERYGLLVIVTLGEALLGTVTAVAAVINREGWSGEAILIVTAGTGLAFGLWWSYFIIPSTLVLERHRERKWAWGYGHIVLFGSLAGVGAGFLVAADAVRGDSSIGTVEVVLAVVMPALVFCITYFTLYSILFRAVDTLHVLLAAGTVLVLVAAVVLAMIGLSLGWCLMVVMLSPFVTAGVFETVGYKHVAADVKREG